MTIKINSLIQKYTKEKREYNQDISMIEIIITREIIRMEIDQRVEIEGHHIDVEVSMNKVIEEDHIMSITTEMIIQETTSEIFKIIEVKI